MCAAVQRLRRRLGRRGAFLLIIGVGKICWGAGFIVVPPQPQPPGLELLTSVAPMHCWGWLWMLAGMVTGGCAFVQIGRDGLGFAAALVPPATWATAYTVAVLDGTYSRGVFVALWYLTSHIGVIVWASAVPEYELAPAPRLRGRGEG
ncbi:hypothetical protein ABZ442_04815 [Streptomyces triculaminicus]|uniref:hypothetical protein n=1 Tax=Streptomyces triculaminicus TaxID=2816232 RepID=UPI0033C6E947